MIKTSEPLAARWKDVGRRTVVIGANPSRAAGTATAVAVSAAAVGARPGNSPSSRDSWSDQGGRGNARSTRTASTAGWRGSTQGRRRR
ncbi:hypothetical protein AB0958_37685 [Streptomyces sp. NPDC006655]|uniref:hypothetical protein n=1 Tax=Streptomyces sp. NPDC006655 TaxID=3156898 RepID=UPI00345131A8